MQTMTRVYDSYSQAAAAVRDLEASGIAADDVSLIANKHVSEQYENVSTLEGASTGAGVGAALGGGAGLLAGLGLLAIPGLGPVVAAGWLAATAVGAVGGAVAGGLVGSLVSLGVSEDDAHVYSEAVRRGGTMVTVRFPEGHETQVRAILERHNPVDVAHRRAQYQGEGWSKFDPNAPAYKPSSEEVARIRRSV